MAVPALIVSGYLGSGKTTLVAHLLEQAQADGIKLAIISNEFGNTGIDRALLSSDEGFVELDGGCVCCRLSDELSETIESILQKASPDRLILETSGVALPGEVVLAFWRTPVNTLVSDEVIVVVVDGDRLAHGEVDETFIAQVEAADLLVLNKCDLLSSEERNAAMQRLSEMSGGQPVLSTTQCRVAMDILFPPDSEDIRARRRDPNARPTPHVHEHFETTELIFDGTTDEDTLRKRILDPDILRAKGFVRTAEGVRVVQGVGPRVELTLPRVAVPEGLVGRVVVIRRVPPNEH